MLAAHMQHTTRPGALVQIVDVLRHDQQRAVPLAGLGDMGGVGSFSWIAARLVIEAQRRLGSRARPRACGRPDPVILPQAACAAKGIDPALGGNPRAGRDHDVGRPASVIARPSP